MALVVADGELVDGSERAFRRDPPGALDAWQSIIAALHGMVITGEEPDRAGDEAAIAETRAPACSSTPFRLGLPVTSR